MKNLSRSDWGELGSDMEHHHAFELLFDKSTEEIFDLIFKSPLTVSACLFYINEKPRNELLNILAEFTEQYYIEFEDIHLICGPFVNTIIKYQLYAPNESEPYMNVFNKIIDNQEKYGLDLDIYGDCKKEFDKSKGSE
jgi:hypothetical protein